MSRIGKKPVEIPEKTEVTVAANVISVKGPLGELTQEIHPLVQVDVKDGLVVSSPKDDSIKAKAMWGTMSSLVSSMIQGVNTAFEKKLIVEGVGFKVDIQGNKLILNIGFSHPVEIEIPSDLNVSAEKNVISISGISKHKVGQFAAVVRANKKPEPYKGKGIRYDDEVVRRKEGKKSV